MKSITTVVEAFRHELQKLHERMDYPRYKTNQLTLTVEYSGEQAQYYVQFGQYDEKVRGTDLGKVMDEVYRRLGYEHQAAAQIESSMLRLTAD